MKPTATRLVVLALSATLIVGIFVFGDRFLFKSSPPSVSLPNDSASPALSNQPASSTDPVLYAVGDIANCDRTEDESTAELLKNTTGTIVILGDSVYSNGTLEEYQTCFHPAWGGLFGPPPTGPGES
jgi:hypothetical protein